MGVGRLLRRMDPAILVVQAMVQPSGAADGKTAQAQRDQRNGES